MQSVLIAGGGQEARDYVRGSAESVDGCLDEAIEVLSRPGPNEILPSPKGGNVLNRCLSGISGDPLHSAVLSRRATGDQLSTQQC